MRALVLYGPNDYRIENSWQTPQLCPGWALIKVKYAGICGSDMPRFFKTGSYHSPMIIGHEFSGVVAQTNPDSSLKEGTPVAILPIIPCGECDGCVKTGEAFHCRHYQFIGSRNDGGFAEYCLVKEENLFPLEKPEDLQVGAMIEPLAVGLHVVRRNGKTDGKSVVFGSGPVGLACGLWMHFLGEDVTMVDVREFNLQKARELGLKAVPFDELKPDERFDSAIEASGSEAALLKAVELVDDLGSITVVGRNSGSTTFSNQLFEKLMRKEITLKGCWGYNMTGEEALMRRFLKEADVSKLITRMISLDEAPQVLEEMNMKAFNYCKVMICFN